MFPDPATVDIDTLHKMQATLQSQFNRRKEAANSPKSKKDKFPKTIDFSSSENLNFNELLNQVNIEIKKRESHGS